ncbi:pseudouridine synthase pus4 [Naganishia albida]|nr:pseudouridine synthase pus4 [Naganishia albida]
MPKSVPLPTFPLSGLVPLEKPSGPTSMRIIDYIKPLLAESPLFHSPEATSRAAIKAEVKKLMKHRGGLKIGQGGTLDPLADGVLVIGVNKGTKQLGQFLHCTKTYTTTALLGSCTTTYDSEGPILSTAPWAHVTREVIEQALDKFRGDIMQVPPIFSALKMDGKPLYEYARTNTPLPRPIDARRAHISLLQLESFTPATLVPGDGGHTYTAPEKQLSEEEREVYFRMSRLTREAGVVEKAFGVDTDDGKKGKKTAPTETVEQPVQHLDIPDLPQPEQTSEPMHVRPPTFTLRMTVSSGTYVRSIVHDIALSIGSAAHVVKLTRTRQGQFSLTPADEEPAKEEDSTEWYIQDSEERFDFGARKTGCIPWSVFERAIEARKSAPKADDAEDPEEAANDEESAGNSTASPLAKWQLKEWEKEFLARFVPV